MKKRRTLSANESMLGRQFHRRRRKRVGAQPVRRRHLRRQRQSAEESQTHGGVRCVISLHGRLAASRIAHDSDCGFVCLEHASEEADADARHGKLPVAVILAWPCGLVRDQPRLDELCTCVNVWT